MISHAARRKTFTPPLAAAFAVLLAQAPGAMAFERQDIVCELDDLTREISLRADPHSGYVCDVLYEKPDEGDTREVLWSARNNVDYCKPRFDDMVDGMASRGWTCDYADTPPESDDEPPAIGAATDARREDDEASSEGARGVFRDRCVADAAGAADVPGGDSVKGYCDCVADGMDSGDLTEDDARIIFDGLSAAAAAADAENGDGAENGDDAANGDKRLNTLAANYESVVESCR